MADSFTFPVSNSELASAALRASKQLNQVADSARASEGKAAQSCNKPSQPKQWKGTNKESTRLPCPHCKWPSVIRTSEQMSVLTRQYVFCCANAECGHTFVATLEISRTLSPSATPDPSVNLPLSSHVRRDMLRVTLDHAASAEHQARNTTPVTGDLFVQGVPPPD